MCFRGYMAPEITRGQLTEKVDVFSYGVLLMEIVTGRITMSVTQYGTPTCLIDEVRPSTAKQSFHFNITFRFYY